MALLLTACVAFLGGYLGLRYKVPAGALVGAMIATLLLNVFFGMAYMPPGLKFYTQIATGAYVGAKISRSDAVNLRKVLWPAVILATVMLAFAVSVGYLLCVISPLSVPTALFCMAPAGTTDMTLASMDFPDAEPSMVALIQTLRVMFTILLMPPIIRRIAQKRPGGGAAEEPLPQGKPAGERSLPRLAVTLLIALLCGRGGPRPGGPRRRHRLLHGGLRRV